MTWIKTSDELPEPFVDDGGVWHMAEDGHDSTTPTHWMPLPEPPK